MTLDLWWTALPKSSLSEVCPRLARAVEIERLEQVRLVGVDPAGWPSALVLWKVDPITGVWSIDSLERAA